MKALELAEMFGNCDRWTELKDSHYDQAAAELRRLAAVNAELVEALGALLARDKKNTCQHETTHRGGSIWEICDDCGAQWADDDGGKPNWKEPIEWEKADSALAKAKEQQ